MYIMAVEELSRVCATTGVVVSAHTSLCMNPILEFGTEEQKMKYLPKLASGEWIGAFGLTEPNAGTDAAMQQTNAVLDGDEGRQVCPDDGRLGNRRLNARERQKDSAKTRSSDSVVIFHGSALI